MSSEIIVVLALIVLSVGFIIWVRMNSHDHGPGEQAENQAGERDSAGSRK
jgi:hypothetical protein